jgi:hypothetical protein
MQTDDRIDSKCHITITFVSFVKESICTRIKTDADSGITNRDKEG